MNILELSSAVFAGAFEAGLLGSMTGLGGGVIIVSLLTLVFGVDIRSAIGASLVSVIATSSGAAIAYVREGHSNIRIGMFLEIATTIGASIRGTARHARAHARHCFDFRGRPAFHRPLLVAGAKGRRHPEAVGSPGHPSPSRGRLSH